METDNLFNYKSEEPSLYDISLQIVSKGDHKSNIIDFINNNQSLFKTSSNKSTTYRFRIAESNEFFNVLFNSNSGQLTFQFEMKPSDTPNNQQYFFDYFNNALMTNDYEKIKECASNTEFKFTKALIDNLYLKEFRSGNADYNKIKSISNLLAQLENPQYTDFICELITVSSEHLEDFHTRYDNFLSALKYTKAFEIALDHLNYPKGLESALPHLFTVAWSDSKFQPTKEQQVELLKIAFKHTDIELLTMIFGVKLFGNTGQPNADARKDKISNWKEIINDPISKTILETSISKIDRYYATRMLLLNENSFFLPDIKKVHYVSFNKRSQTPEEEMEVDRNYNEVDRDYNLENRGEIQAILLLESNNETGLVKLFKKNPPEIITLLNHPAFLKLDKKLIEKLFSQAYLNENMAAVQLFFEKGIAPSNALEIANNFLPNSKETNKQMIELINRYKKT